MLSILSSLQLYLLYALIYCLLLCNFHHKQGKLDADKTLSYFFYKILIKNCSEHKKLTLQYFDKNVGDA